MLPILSLYLVLATGLPAAGDPPPQRILQTVRTSQDGTSTVDERFVAANTTTLQAIDADGRIVDTTWHPRQRVLIELAAPPRLDRTAPGSSSAAASQRAQLAHDLLSIDARLQTATQSVITREYDTLFSGVAATVDAAAIAEIRRLPNVKSVHADVRVRASVTQSVPLIGASAAASTYSVTGAGVKVAVIDTGIDYTHDDLGGCFGVGCKVAGGYDFVNDDSDPRDDNGHGTHVAGIISANGALKGVAPGATLLAYKVLGSDGWGPASNIIAALEQAVLDGAQIANLSLGGQGSPDDPTSQALDNATAAGMLSVVAAGNWGSGYRTIESPGVARTALTVGATNKSWQMASFSARGYVADGDRYLMKPELVAPGVDIRSTVTTAGTHGDPSGYKLLSGTSMATPHVAGSAALLLQWNAAQTPAELKSRLVSSARAITGDVFTRGAGGIDVLAAFGTTVLVSNTHVSFDVVHETTGVVVRERSLTIRNANATADTLTLAASPALPSGATLEIIPSSVTLQPGESVDVTLRLQVDTAVVMNPPESLAWSTNLSISGAPRPATVPAYFFRGSLVTLTFDEPPLDVVLVSESSVVSFFGQTLGTTQTMLVRSGLWDVITFFAPESGGDNAVVVHEQQNVQGSFSLNIHRGQAARTIALRAVDDQEQPLDGSKFGKELVIHLPRFTLIIGSWSDFRVSDLSSRYAVGITGTGPDPSDQKYFISTWTADGLSSDVTLPASGKPFRRLAQSVVPLPQTAPATMTICTGFHFTQSVILLGTLGCGVEPASMSRTLYFQSTSSPDATIRAIQQSRLVELAFPFKSIIEGSYVHQKNDVELELSGEMLFGFDGSTFAPAAVLGAGIERWDLDTPLHALALDFWNSSSMIRAGGFGLGPGWLTQTLSTIRQVANAEPTLDLYRSGAFVGSYTFRNLGEGISAPAAAHEIRATSQYEIGEVSGSSSAVISFDTRRFDSKPPYVSNFHIEQNGIRTPSPFYPSNATPIVKFRVTGSSSVALDWRMNGTDTWTPLPLTITGSDYEALIEQEGAIDLRLTAADSAGNTFQEEWTPALITTAPPPPGPPSFLSATRAAAAQIALSWAAASGVLEISRYRIERLPDNATFETSGPETAFDDTTGLVPGNAYLYRVSAIDTNGGVSSPSPYDLATLIELQDDPLVPNATLIRGAHVVDLRRAIDAIRVAAGLGPAWTNYDPPAGRVHASVFSELRNRLNEARGTLALPTVEFLNTVAPGSVIRATDVEALRDGVQ